MAWIEDGIKVGLGIVITTAVTYLIKKGRPMWRFITEAVKVNERLNKIELDLELINCTIHATLYISKTPAFTTNEKGEVDFLNPAWLKRMNADHQDEALGFSYMNFVPKEEKGNMRILQTEQDKHPSNFNDEVRLQPRGSKDIVTFQCVTNVIKIKGTLKKTVGMLYEIQ